MIVSLPLPSRKAGIGWILCFVDTDGGEHTVTHSDVFYFTMSVHVRWYSINIPPLHRIRKLRIYAVKPVFFDDKGKPVKNR